jgi:hypothetical protein
MDALHEYLFILREELNKDIKPLIKKFSQDHARDSVSSAFLDEEDVLSESDSLEVLTRIIQIQVLQGQLLETSQELIKITDGNLSLIENLDFEVAELMRKQLDSVRSDVAKTINQRREKGTLNTLEEQPNDEKNQWDNEMQPSNEKLITRQDLIRIGKITLILSISLILPGYLFFAGLRIGWTIALFVGFMLVAWLGYSIKR